MQENINIPDSTITTNLSFRQLVLMNMQQLTNFPYIEKDFDALTDYELLCLVVKFLNDVIANQNEQNDSITRMYQSFLALQDYVNNTKDELEDAFNNLDDYVRNYFDNLDVQKEINNKLDQMLEDGVLEQIIEQFLQSTALWSFDTVANLKLATNLTNGSFTKTMGYYSVNDGGSSTYKIRTKTNDDVIDDEFILSLYNENLVAELIITDKINVKCLGINNTNFITKINSLLNNQNYIKYPIYIPNDNYTISSPIIVSQQNTILTIDSNINIETDISILKITSSNNKIIINGTFSSAENNPTGTGIEIGNDSISVGFNNIFVNTILNTKNGILINPNNNYGVHYNKIKFNKITADYGIRFKVGDTSTPWINENTFIGGRLSGGIGIYTEKGTNQTDPYNGNKFNEIGYEDIECAIELNFARWNYFNECRMAEHLNGDYWIYCHSDSYGNTFNIQHNIRVSTLRDDNNSMNYRNIYNPNAICDADWYRIGKSCYSAGGLFAIPEGECYDNDKLNIQHYNQSGAITNPAIFSSDAVISIGGDNANANYDVILPAGVFNIRKIKSFYIYVVYKEASSTINIKDSDNNTLIDTTLFGDAKVSKKLYQVKYLPDRYAGYTWKLIELNIK